MADPKKVSDLRPAEYNPRKITDEQLKRLKRSMDEYGDLSGIVFNRRSGNVIGGHQRVKKFDPEWVIDKIPVTDKTGTVALGRIKTPEGEWGYREVDWDEKKEQGANIAANKHGGDWDIPKLKDLLVGLDDGEFDLTLTGFDEAELKKMIDYDGKEPTGEDWADHFDKDAPEDLLDTVNMTFNVKKENVDFVLTVLKRFAKNKNEAFIKLCRTQN